MVEQIDFKAILEECDLAATPHRTGVLTVIAADGAPLTADEIHVRLNRRQSINKVTVYRILDLLVKRKALERVRSCGRGFRYGLSPRGNHPHFCCRCCGRVECLAPESVYVDVAALEQGLAGSVERVEVRLEGVCRQCLGNLDT